MLDHTTPIMCTASAVCGQRVIFKTVVLASMALLLHMRLDGKCQRSSSMVTVCIDCLCGATPTSEDIGVSLSRRPQYGTVCRLA